MTTEGNTKTYPPELSIDYDPTEPNGLRKVKEVPKQKKVGGNWVPAPELGTKWKAVAVNRVHVVLPYADSYKQKNPDGSLSWPLNSYTGMPSVNWRMFIVGPIAVDTDGSVLTKAALPVEVQWRDSTTQFWVYDVMTKVIQTAFQQYPGSNIKDHVFEFGKKEGKSPSGSFTFRHLGLLRDLYPATIIPKGEARERSGPSESVMRSLPKGYSMPAPQVQVNAQAGSTVNVGTGQQANTTDLFNAPPPRGSTTSTVPFVPTPAEMRIAEAMRQRLQEQSTTLSKLCESRSLDPFALIFNTFTKGSVKDEQNQPVITTTERAEIIARNPSIVGIEG